MPRPIPHVLAGFNGVCFEFDAGGHCLVGRTAPVKVVMVSVPILSLSVLYQRLNREAGSFDNCLCRCDEVEEARKASEFKRFLASPKNEFGSPPDVTVNLA